MEYVDQCRNALQALPMNDYLEQGRAVLEQVPHYIQQIPDDMLVSMGIGAVVCGVFLTFGNTKMPLIYGLTYGTQKPVSSSDTDKKQSEDNDDPDRDAQKEAVIRLNKIAAAAGADNITINKKCNTKNITDDTDITKPRVETDEDSSAEVTDTTTNDVDNVELTEEDQEVLAKLKQFQKDFNVSDDTVKKAIEQTAKQQASGMDSNLAQAMDGPVITWVRMLDIVVLALLLLIGAYWMNLTSHGDAGRVLLNMFPRELKTMGLDDYLRNFTGK